MTFGTEPRFPARSVSGNLRAVVAFEGTLDTAALEQAVHGVIARHATLRAYAARAEGEAPISFVDLSTLPAAERKAALAKAADELCATPAAVPVRLSVLRLAEASGVLLLTLHGSVADTDSLAVFMHDLTALYQAAANRCAAELPPLTAAYTDLAAWLRAPCSPEQWQEEIAYWQGRLTDLPALDLPADHPRSATGSGKTATVTFTLPDTLGAALGQVEQALGTDRHELLLAAFQTLLYRYSGQADLAFATILPRHNHPGRTGLIGPFENTIILRGDLSGNPRFTELPARLRAELAQAGKYTAVPFARLAEALQPEQAPGHSPLVRAVFQLRQPPLRTISLPGLTLRPASVTSVAVPFELALTLEANGDSLTGCLEYSSELYERETVCRMADHFRTLLEGIAANPDQPVGSLPLLPAAEREQLLITWNQTAGEYERDRCAHELFEQHAQENPDAAAVAHGRDVLSYAELNSRANQLAHYLRRMGVGPDVRVGICMERSADMVVGIFGVLKAGGAYIPMDPGYPSERLAFMFEDAGIAVLLTQERLRPHLPQLPEHLHVLCLDADWANVATESTETPRSGVTPDNLAYVIYTSGSTGTPKGVCVRHEGLVNLLTEFQRRQPVGIADRGAVWTSISFDVSVFEVFTVLCFGAALYVVPEELRSSAPAVLRWLSEHAITSAYLPPFMITDLLAWVREDGPALKLRRLVVGVEPILEAHLTEIASRIPGICIINGYGPTETTVCATLHTVHAGEATHLNTPIGRPVQNALLYVLDSHLQPVPIGVVGELYIGGVGVAAGYHNRPELTAQRFIANPFGSGRLYKTGDLVRYLPDGNLMFVGRIDHQVKLRGYRIELGEIETLLAQHPAVRETVVTIWVDETGSKRLVAYVAAGDGTVSAADLRRHLQERLPEYMVPAAFVVLPQLPKTPNGKTDRRALPAPRLTATAEYAAPRTPVEEILAGIWQDLLKKDRVGRHDHFLELGGHSLLATRLVSAIREAFHVELPLRTFIERPTVAEQAEAVEQALEAGTTGEAVPLVSVDRTGNPALSFAQQRLWFLDQLVPGSALYNIAQAFHMAGTLQVDVLWASVAEIVRRHEVLRTAFVATDDGLASQVIMESADIPLDLIDLTDLPVERRQERAQALMSQEARRPFALSGEPLMRCLLLKLGETEHTLLLTMHHIISDGWSMGVFFQELSALYEAFTSQKESPLPSLPIQYADFAVWQRRWLQGERLEEQLAYWKRQLSGSPAVLEFPTDQPRPAVQTFRGATQRFTLPAALSDSVKALSQREGATLYMTLLAAFGAVLNRYSGQEDICVGTPIANRNRAETEGLIGFFVNTLVMRLNLSENPTFRELLHRVREAALGGYAHQDLPFEQLVEVLRPERDQSYSPLFQHMFVLQNAPMKAELPGLTVTPAGVDTGTAKFDLTLFLEEGPAGLSGQLEYNTDLFSPGITRLISHFQTILEAAVANPDQPVALLPMLTPAERQQMLVDWNRTEAPFPADRCAHELVEAQAALHPDATAVVAGETTLTFRELDQRANQMASRLQALGVGPDRLVGICMERSAELVVAMLGVLKAGGAYVPMDPTYPPDRLSYMLADARVEVLLTQDRLRGLFPACPAPMICVDTDWQSADLAHAERPVCLARPENLAYIIYTSGSTGRPKGVMIEHRGLVNYLTWAAAAYEIERGTGAPVQSSVAFDLTVTSLLGSLVAGRCAVLLPERDGVETLGEALQAAEGFSLVKITPAHLLLLGQQLPPAAAAGRTRMMVIGGEALTPEAIAFWQEHAPETVLINEYGPTETVVGCCTYAVPAGVPALGVIPIGRPIANTQLYVLDRQMQPVPVGVIGELYIGGAGVARGYLNRPELTAERFVRNPFQAGSRLYRTGDLARYRADGILEYLGRVDDQVKIRGFRIEPGEIEAMLSGHPAVRECAVVAQDDAAGLKRLVAFVVWESGQEAAAGDLRSGLRQHLPEYMVPSAFVTLPSLPLTSNGKVDRKRLAQFTVEQLPADRQFSAPRTDTETLLANIWQEVLGLSRISMDDNFFEIGGHSLLVMRVVSRIRQVFEVDLSLSEAFAAPTLGALAAVVHGKRSQADGCPILPVDRTAPLPLSFAQQRLWILDQLVPDSSLYHMAEAYHMYGPLQPEALRASLTEIVRRHEALRTTFVKAPDGTTVQHIASATAVPLTEVDLTDLPEARRQECVAELVATDARHPFDLAAGPLVRCTLLKLADTEHILVLTMHHIVSDGWSMGVFRQELRSLYEAFAAGTSIPLPDLPIQYADYAAWQREWLEGERLEEQLSFWKQQLRGIPPLLELPTDRPRPAVQSYAGALKRFTVPRDLTDALHALSRREGATLFMTLLSAFNVLLSRYSRQQDICVGVPIANRNRREIEGLIGFFVNTVVMRTRLEGVTTFGELVRQVRKTALDAYAHQDVPFEQVVEALQPERNLSQSPLFQVMFVFQGAAESSETYAGLTVSQLPLDMETSKFDLSLELQEIEDGLAGAVEYSTDLYDEATIARMIDQFRTLLAAIAADPSCALPAISMLPEHERQQLLTEWSQGPAAAVPATCLHTLIAEQTERTPAAVALVAGTEQLSYRELNRRANQMAHYLRSLGVGPGVLVGIYLQRTADLLVTLLGVLKAGGGYVPLDPAYPSDRAALTLEAAQVALLVTEQQVAGTLPSCSGQVIRLEQVRAAISGMPVDNPAGGAAPDDLAYVLYTSGSTGRPKGVALEHRCAVNFAHWVRSVFSDEELSGVLAATSICFDLSVFELFTPLCWGGTVVLADNALHLANLPAAKAVRLINTVPSAIAELLRLNAIPESVQTVNLAGEPLQSGLVQQLYGRKSIARVYNLYGPTETTTYSTFTLVPRGTAPTIGRPILNTSVYLLDEQMRPAPIGVPGELYIGGGGVARGYLHQPELTEQRFLRNPFDQQAGSRLYKTGDLVRYCGNGVLQYLGRLDHQVKVRGFRIELGEIEAVLHQHPAVRQAVVMARETAPGDKRLVAYLVPESPEPLDVADIRTYLRTKLPDYMVPAAFMVLDAMPLTPNGKVDRLALPMPTETAVQHERYTAPRNSVEQALCQIFAEVLHLSAVGIDDDFFSLGGHSLLATQVIARVQQTLGAALPLRAVFEHPTVAELAQSLEAGALQAVEEVAATAEELLADRTRALLDNLDELTDEELEALLQELDEDGGTR